MQLDKARVQRIIKAALKEDIGEGDITSVSIIPKLASVKASIVAKEECVVCGIDIAEWVQSACDYTVRFKPQVEDKDTVRKGKEIAFIEGRARGILKAERTMLNFLSLLSGIATEAKKYADKVKKYNVKIMDTRKTFPLLRYLEKYAVTVGEAYNHRMDLSEMVLVKDNHIRVHGTRDTVQGIRKKVQKGMRIEIEVDDIKQFEEVLKERPDIIMLDNMSVSEVKKAVEMRKTEGMDKVALEVSGGITLDNVEDYAKTGIDTISVGALTDSVRGIDFSLNII